MYEAGSRSLAIRKSPSMPTLDIANGGGDLSLMEMTRWPSGRKTSLYQRKMKSAISLCVGILICTIVLFVLVALDPSKVAEEPWRLNSRGPRMLVAFPSYRHWSSHALLARVPSEGEAKTRRDSGQVREGEGAALEGMGTLFRKGTHGMPHLVVAHLSETTTPEDLRLFLRGLHRSGMLSRADVTLLFPWRPLAVDFLVVIREEESYFHRLLAKSLKQNHAAGRKPMGVVPDRVQMDDPKLSVFNFAEYSRPPSITEFPKGRQDSIWGKSRTDSTVTKVSDSEISQEEEVHYGAVVGFDMQELDPDDTLSGFLDSPPVNLRRWVCYQILLGMVRHKYRHALLTEVSGVVILKDVFSPLKKRDANLHLYYNGHKWSDIDPHVAVTKNLNFISNGSNDVAPSERLPSNITSVGVMESLYGKSFWNSLDVEDKRKKVISTGVILGGIRPIRSVATAMATEIVRLALLRKSRNPFQVEPVLTYLVHRSSVLGRKVASHLQVHESGMSNVNLLPGPPRTSSFDDFFRRPDTRFAVLQGLNNPETTQERRKQILESLRKDICWSQNDLEIYTDCYALGTATEMDAFI